MLVEYRFPTRRRGIDEASDPLCKHRSGLRFAGMLGRVQLLFDAAGSAEAGSRGNRRGNHDRPRWRLGHVRGIQPAGRAGRERDHGYSWTSAIEGSTLALYTEKSISAEEAYPTEDANRVGAEGSHLFSFKGMAAGDGTIALSYERSWEQTDDDKKIVLQVKTGQNGAIESVSVG